MEPQPSQNPGRRTEEQERILKAAVLMSDGEIVAGDNHEKIMSELWNRNLLSKMKQTGFVTNKGRFVSREEAAKIAFDAGQTKKVYKSLLSEDLHSE